MRILSNRRMETEGQKAAIIFVHAPPLSSVKDFFYLVENLL